MTAALTERHEKKRKLVKSKYC